jgi:transcriptional antiterminator RfaH
MAWYVVETRSHAEAKAQGHLIRQGFETYLPRYLKSRRHARRVETVAAPLFPRYLFVSVDVATQRWRSIHSTIGVARLVCNGEEPASVPDAVVMALRGREDARGYIQLERRPQFAPGAPVRIIDGVYAGKLGLFEDMAEQERVSVLIEMLGRKISMLVNQAAIAAA